MKKKKKKKLIGNLFESVEMEESSRGSKRENFEMQVDEEIDLFRKRFRKEIDGLNCFDSDSMMDIWKEQLSLFSKGVEKRIKSVDHGESCKLAEQMKLQFKDKISPKILTGEEIKSEQNDPIKVALVELSTENLVDTGEKASSRVEIVLLNGELGALDGDHWTSQEFEKNVVQEILVGNTRVQLDGGIAVVKNIKLKHRAKKMNPSMFRLGARILDTNDRDRVKEAKTERFEAKIYREKYFKKEEKPSVKDEVFRLVNIRKDGEFHKRLEREKIYTVGDFLLQLLIDPEGLQRTVKMAPKKWRDTLDNARACRDKVLYCYTDFQQQRKPVVFNILGEVQPIGRSASSSENHVEAQKLMDFAHKNWGDVKTFDDENSLHVYLASLSKTHEPPNYREEKESPTSSFVSTKSNFTFQSMSPTSNSGIVAKHTLLVDNLNAPFSIKDTEIVDTVSPPYPRPRLNPQPISWINMMVYDFDKWYRNQPKWWKRLMCVFRWICRKKKPSQEHDTITKPSPMIIDRGA